MRQAGIYLCGTPTGWRVIEFTDSTPVGLHTDRTGSDELDVQGVRRYLKEAEQAGNKNGSRIVVGVPASWCLCASVSTEGLPRGSSTEREQALAFRLESLLPITVEDCAIGLLGTGPRRLGVAVQAGRLDELVHALEDDGHEILAIVPRGLLVAQGVFDGANLDAVSQCTGLLFQASHGDCVPGPIQLLLLDPDQSPRWRLLLADPAALAGQLELDGVRPDDARRWLISPSVNRLFEQVLSQAGEPKEVGVIDEAEANSALGILNRSTTQWLNLNRGPLAPRHPWRRLRVPLTACTAAAMVLLITATALLFLRAHQYQQIADHHDQTARDTFTQAMPGQAVPPSPQRRLQTRLKQLRGQQGLAAGDQELMDAAPTLTLLLDALNGLPIDQRFAVTDLRLDDGELRLTGHARSHGEADQLANALRTQSAFVVEPPSTDNLPDGGVRFMIQATYRPHAEQASPQDTAPRSGSKPALAERTHSEVSP